MVFEDLRFFDLIDTTNNGTWNHVVAEADEAMAQATTIEPRSLPSLKEVVISKPKKKMGTNITLSEFNNCSFDYGLMRDETFTLLTSPKERFA
ncbi:hypothetical protein JHK87_048065 [Glycine soja]|nr:hypothetical protein JHK87_048065 [Glycine soja]